MRLRHIAQDLDHIYGAVGSDDGIGMDARSGGRGFRVIEQSDPLEGGTEIRFRAQASDAAGLSSGDTITIGEDVYQVVRVEPLRQTGEVYVRCQHAD